MLFDPKDLGFKEVTFPLAANGSYELYYSGQSFLAISVAGSVEFAPNDQEWSVLRAGSTFQDFLFTKLRFRETAGNAGAVTFFYGQGRVDYRTLIVSGAIDVKPGGTLTGGAVTVGTAAAQYIAADANARSVSIYNASTSATVYIGFDNTLTTANGMPVPPLAEREIRTADAIWAIASAAGVDTRYLKEAA